MQDAPALEDSYLRNWFADVRSAKTQAQTLFDQLSSDQKLWKPEPRTWSVAECFDHLVITADLYHPNIDAALSEVRGTEAPGKKPFRARWIQGRFIGAIGPQSRRKLKALRRFRPTAADLDVSGVERSFLSKQEELAEMIRRADGCDLNRGKVRSPVRILSFTLGEAFWLVTAHAQRHLLQAQNLPRLDAFPAD